MEYLVGIVLSLAVSAMATLAGFDRERSFYPVLVMVVASYYGLFAVMGGSIPVLIAEAAIMAVFIAASIAGFRLNLWLAAGALLAHGIFDLFHGHIIQNKGMPVWWPGFCSAYDVMAAGYVAWMLKRRPRSSSMTANQDQRGSSDCAAEHEPASLRRGSPSARGG